MSCMIRVPTSLRRVATANPAATRSVASDFRRRRPRPPVRPKAVVALTARHLCAFLLPAAAAAAAAPPSRRPPSLPPSPAVSATQVRPDELDDRALAALADLPVHTAVETLDAFAKLDLSGVRSKSAYVMGMVNRTRRDGAPAAVHLPPEVQQRLDTLVGAGRISSAEFDHRCLDALSNVTAALALRALDLFAEKRSAQEVRNVPAFFASLLKQVEQEQRDGSRDRDRYRERERDPRDPRDWRERPGQQGPGAGYGGADGSLSGAGAGLNGGLGMPGALGRLGMAAGSLPMAVLPGGGSLPAAGLDALQQQQQLMLQQAMLAQQQQQQLQPGVLPGLTPAQAELLGQLAAALPPSVAVASQLQLPPITAAAAAPGSLLPPTAAPSSAAIPMGSLAAMLERKRDHGVEQRMLGVRTDELHGLSVFARYVHPAPALKLQQLWDTGVRLVSLLDDRTWEALSDLQAPDALVVIDETVEKMLSPSPLRNVNAYFMVSGAIQRVHLFHCLGFGCTPEYPQRLPWSGVSQV